MPVFYVVVKLRLSERVHCPECQSAVGWYTYRDWSMIVKIFDKRNAVHARMNADVVRIMNDIRNTRETSVKFFRRRKVVPMAFHMLDTIFPKQDIKVWRNLTVKIRKVLNNGCDYVRSYPANGDAFLWLSKVRNIKLWYGLYSNPFFLYLLWDFIIFKKVIFNFPCFVALLYHGRIIYAIWNDTN